MRTDRRLWLSPRMDLPRFAIIALLSLVGFQHLKGEARLSEGELTKIGRRVWQNECNGSIEGLTSWNSGENFASLGIGHFIWYPRGVHGPFDESFPKLLAFLKERKGAMPDWLQTATDCPWPDRAAFMADLQSDRMKELRAFLARTVHQQAAFLAERSREALPKMLTAAPAERRAYIEEQYHRLATTGAGVFALIDYVNFKGEGVLPTERYQGEGWGLLQVLTHMRGKGSGAARDFSNSAREVLERRIRNSPPERGEQRWLAGWKNRVESYAQ
jgi:hypothetical protein